MHKKVEIVGAKDTEKGTRLSVKVPEENITKDLMKYIQNNKVKGYLIIDDGRRITGEQRKKIYAMIRDISNHLGEDEELQKNYLKYEFIAKNGGSYFSLSSMSEYAASISQARKFITFLIDYSFKHSIPTRDTLLNATEDIDKYLYLCLKYKKCCICNELKADLHHEQAIGMGRDRRTIDDRNNLKISLCRKHHNEAHQMGIYGFRNKYHVYGIEFDEEDVSEWAYDLDYI